jgi:hypothetical protein
MYQGSHFNTVWPGPGGVYTQTIWHTLMSGSFAPTRVDTDTIMIPDGITSCFDDTIPLGLSWARYQITLRFQEAVPRPKPHSYRRHFLRKQREQHLRPADLSLLELVTILLLMRPPHRVANSN